MKHNLKQPCNDCPYRRDSTRGWLGGSPPDWFVRAALSDFAEYAEGAPFAPCHQTVDYEDPSWLPKLGEVEACVGALQMCHNNGKLPRDPVRSAAVKAAGENDNVFRYPAEFIEHHDGEDVLSRSWVKEGEKMQIKITLEVDDGDEWADPDHEMGITEEAFKRLTGDVDYGPPPLNWLGEVQDVERVKE